MKNFFKQLLALGSVFVSRKLLMAFIAIWMIYGSYWGAVKMLYTFESPEQIAAFTSFTNYMLWATATIALWYIGVQAASNFKNGISVASLLQNSISSISEKSEEKIEITEKVDERIVTEYAEKYADDLSYRPIVPHENSGDNWR